MKKISICLFVIFAALSVRNVTGNEYSHSGQKVIAIPVAGNSWVINDISGDGKIITESGISGWDDKSMRIRTYFSVEQTGLVSIALRARVESGSAVIMATFGEENKTVIIRNQTFDTITIGNFRIDKPGYHWIELQGISKTAAVFADVTDIIISGPPSEGKVYFVKNDFYFGRRGPSVHLRYEIPAEASDIEWFYNEVTIPQGNDVLGSYYMACGFNDGYFGIQVNSSEERRILFSVWSPFKTDKPGDIPPDYKIIMLKKGDDVVTKEFGNEGSGGQSYRKYLWQAGKTYCFLLSAHPSVNSSTDYTAYFYAPEKGKWELIASFRRPKTNSYLKSLYSFLENFMPETGFITRKGLYSNQWVRDTKGNWFELSKVRFTADATARKEARIDYSGGTENGFFFLRNCGFFDDKTEMDQVFSRPVTGKHPEINFDKLP